MSIRAYRLTAPQEYNEVFLMVLKEHEDGTADIIVRYSSNGLVTLANHEETLDASTVEAWKGDWNPETHVLDEHFLEHWVSDRKSVV